MRLIDADEFKKQVVATVVRDNLIVEKGNAMCRLIDRQPTAYDIDKVVEQLESQKSGLTAWAEDEAYKLGLEKAVGIVRTGGIAGEKKTGWKEHFASRFCRIE